MNKIAIAFITILLLYSTYTLAPAGDIGLYPDTENSPSIYILPFTLSKALPTNSYIFVTMDWYTSNLNPYNCILVNTSISVSCVNLASATTLPFTTSQIQKFNSLLDTAKTVAVLVSSNLLTNTVYSLQLHLYNVVPSI